MKNWLVTGFCALGTMALAAVPTVASAHGHAMHAQRVHGEGVHLYRTEYRGGGPLVRVRADNNPFGLRRERTYHPETRGIHYYGHHHGR